MTEREAIKVLKKDSCLDCIVGCKSPSDCIVHCDYSYAIEKAIEVLEENIEEIKLDCHYCEFAICKDDKSDVDCYAVDDAYFDHHVTDSSEAERCSHFGYCDDFPKFSNFKENKTEQEEQKKDCNNCANATDDFNNKVDTGCYMCCKGLENNYIPIRLCGKG